MGDCSLVVDVDLQPRCPMWHHSMYRAELMVSKTGTQQEATPAKWRACFTFLAWSSCCSNILNCFFLFSLILETSGLRSRNSSLSSSTWKSGFSNITLNRSSVRIFGRLCRRDRTSLSGCLSELSSESGCTTLLHYKPTSHMRLLTLSNVQIFFRTGFQNFLIDSRFYFPPTKQILLIYLALDW